ncbi:MAG: hypothetical protein K2K58_03705 [Muribaculaceae bacterium]|nr:hypothetical protein [Muribaculaceae bacterium]
MNVKLSLPTTHSATIVKANLLRRIRNNEIPTWSYTRSNENDDVIFHNPSQYIEDPEKNVIFTIELNQRDNSILFSSNWWSQNPVPNEQQILHHVARLGEMLLKNFYNSGFKIVIS